MPTLTNKRRERFARAVAAGMNRSAAYRKHIAKRGARAETVWCNSSKLAAMVAPRVKELREKLDAAAEDRFVLTKTELMVWLSRVIRARFGLLGEDSDLIQVRSVTEGPRGKTVKLRFADKMQAATLLAKMCGWFEPEQHQVEHVHAVTESPALRMLASRMAARLPGVHQHVTGGMPVMAGDGWQTVAD